MKLHDEHDPEPHVVCFGNPVDGFEYVGPFDCQADALGYAEHHLQPNGPDWWLIALQTPAED
jgi:hypothetical protein